MAADISNSCLSILLIPTRTKILIESVTQKEMVRERIMQLAWYNLVESIEALPTRYIMEA
jgi:hypothetical protein